MNVNTATRYSHKASGSLAVLLGCLLFQTVANAVPSSQSACSVDGSGGPNLITTTAGGGDPTKGDFSPITGMAVKINNGTSARNVILQFSADAGVDDTAEIRFGYSIDGGPITFYGPQNLANHTQYWETRNNLSVARIAAGIHTIQAWWRVSGVAGMAAFMDDRCLTAEKSTQ